MRVCRDVSGALADEWFSKIYTCVYIHFVNLDYNASHCNDDSTFCFIGLSYVILQDVVLWYVVIYLYCCLVLLRVFVLYYVL